MRRFLRAIYAARAPAILALTGLLVAVPAWKRSGSLQAAPPLKAVLEPDVRPLVIDWTRNTARIALDVERDLHEDWILFDLETGPVTLADAYAQLDAVLERAAEGIKTRRIAGPEDALNASLEIHRQLRDEGYRYRDLGSWEYHLLGNTLFGCELVSKRVFCLGYVLLYVGIAEHLGLPLRAIYLPGHVSLRWTLGTGGHMNWEATVPNRCDDAFYMEWKRLSPDLVRRGVYLRGLTKRELIALVLYNKSQVYRERRRPDEALATLRRAVELFPAYPDAYNHMGVIWAAEGNDARAIESYRKALELDPGFPEAFYNRAVEWARIGNRLGAERDLLSLQSLDPSLSRRLEHLLHTEGGSGG